jgi:hypothetical protein
MSTPTPQQIKDQYAEYIAEGRTHPEARQGVRTWCKGEISASSPPPYALRPLVKDASAYQFGHANPAVRASEWAAFLADENARRAESLASVTDAHHLAASRYNATAAVHDRVLDGRHYAQKAHGTALWVQSDSLVAAALGGA